MGLLSLEVPLELHTRGAVGAWRDKCAAKFWRHDHFANVLLIKEVAREGGNAPALATNTHAEVGDAVGVYLSATKCAVIYITCFASVAIKIPRTVTSGQAEEQYTVLRLAH